MLPRDWLAASVALVLAACGARRQASGAEARDGRRPGDLRARAHDRAADRGLRALTESELAIFESGLRDGVLKREKKVDPATVEGLIQNVRERAQGARAAEGEDRLGGLPGARWRRSRARPRRRPATSCARSPRAPARAPVRTTPSRFTTTARCATARSSTAPSIAARRRSFRSRRVIPCWTQALQTMKVGGKYKLTCPSDIAYGDRGSPPTHQARRRTHLRGRAARGEAAAQRRRANAPPTQVERAAQAGRPRGSRGRRRPAPRAPRRDRAGLRDLPRRALLPRLARTISTSATSITRRSRSRCSRSGARSFGDGLFALRFLPGVAGAATVFLTGLVARELGGGRAAQVLAALAAFFAPFFLAVSHFYSMNAFDLLAWSALWLAGGADPRARRAAALALVRRDRGARAREQVQRRRSSASDSCVGLALTRAAPAAPLAVALGGRRARGAPVRAAPRLAGRARRAVARVHAQRERAQERADRHRSSSSADRSCCCTRCSRRSGWLGLLALLFAPRLRARARARRSPTSRSSR